MGRRWEVRGNEGQGEAVGPSRCPIKWGMGSRSRGAGQGGGGQLQTRPALPCLLANSRSTSAIPTKDAGIEMPSLSCLGSKTESTLGQEEIKAFGK